MRAALAIAILTLALAGPAEAQFGLRRKPAGPPAGLSPVEAEAWPFPAPDPHAWWTEQRLKPAEASDPLGGRRLARGQRPPPIDNRIDASTYRLWGLMPLQWQILKPGELALEVWVRPAETVRQSVVRIIVRGDGRAFVQARAGIACCEAGIARRIGLDAELPAGSAQTFLDLRAHPMWAAPRDVRIDEGGGIAEGVCVQGGSYDLTLLTAAGARVLRRACDSAEVGQAADAIEPVLRAALGHDPRFDVLFPGGVSLDAEREAYRGLLARGGALKPRPTARPGPELGPPSPDAAAPGSPPGA